MIESHDMDVFFKNNMLDVATMVNAFWQNKTSEENTEQLCHLLSRYLVEKDVYDEIEFYIPQFGHMIIHFGSKNRKLLKLMIMICQVSLHSCLLLSFIFYAALEDFQPEGPDGVENPHKDRSLYLHCANLLQSIEKVVLLGCPELHKLEDHESGKDKKSMEYEELEAESRVRDSEFIVEQERIERENMLSNAMKGKLMYKRVEKKSVFVRKTWKPRYFRIEGKVLCCYHDPMYEELLRSIPLQDCSAVEVHNPHHVNCFEVLSPITFTVFKLQTESRDDMLKWIDALNRVIDGLPKIHSAGGAGAASETIQHGDVTYNVTLPQKNRFQFFISQRRFLETLTGICEELRFMDPRIHQEELKKRVRLVQPPPYSYLNLCGSTESWTRIVNVLPEESHAFKTKARVPTLLLFEVQQHVKGTDVATFLNEEIGYVMSEEKDSDSSATKTTFESVFKCSSHTTLRSRRRSMWTATPDSIRNLVTEDETEDDTCDVHDDFAKNNLRRESITDDPAAKAGETFAMKTERIRKASPYSNLPGWDLDGLICKSNDDLRQEVFVMQMIKYFIRIFRKENVPVWLLSYTIMSTSQTTGLIQLIPDAKSLDAMKKSSYWPGSLRGYFEKTFGPPDSAPFRQALAAYISSLAGYSVVCYVLAIKDRHNGNIMMDTKGRLIHIDYGFVFGIAPGKKFSMETAPWKLTEEMVDVMGGMHSPDYEKFVRLTTDALTAVRKYTDECLGLMEILAYKSNYPAFSYNPDAMRDLRDRMLPNISDTDLPLKVMEMMNKCYKHSGATRYDKFQVLTNGIAR